MLKKVTFLFLIGLSASCSTKRIVSFEETINQTDTICLKEIAQAKSDLSKQKFVLCNYIGNITSLRLRGEKEMDSLLSPFNIEFRDESSPCVIIPNRTYHCYCEIMQEQINTRFGAKFTDSLLNLADSLYVLKHLEDTFDYTTWDKPPMFPGDSVYDQTNHSGLQKQFDALIEYPKGYKFKNSENSMASIQVYLNIDREGNAKVIDIEVHFWDKKSQDMNSNRQFYDYFRRSAISLIENTKWTPAKSKSFKVGSKNDIFLYLK